MGNHFQPGGVGGAGTGAIRQASIGAARSANAPQYIARGQGIAAQKYVDAANKFTALKPKKHNVPGLYPPGFKED